MAPGLVVWGMGGLTAVATVLEARVPNALQEALRLSPLHRLRQLPPGQALGPGNGQARSS